MKVVAKLRQRGEKDQPPKLLCYIKWLKNVVSFFFLFFFVLKMPKIWVGRTTRNGEKKGNGVIAVKNVFFFTKRRDCLRCLVSGNTRMMLASQGFILIVIMI